MKNLKNILTIGLLASSLLTIGCGSKGLEGLSEASNNNNSATILPSELDDALVDELLADTIGSSEVSITGTSYPGLTMKMGFQSAASGAIQLSYNDSQCPNSVCTFEYTTGTSSRETLMNQFLTDDNGKQGYHAVLEGSFGAIVIVLDQFTDFGDGNGIENISGGSIWIKNFETGVNVAPHPSNRDALCAANPYFASIFCQSEARARCWQIDGNGTQSPYDCRPWPVEHKANTVVDAEDMNDHFRSIYPEGGYTKLGDFEGLGLYHAFNGSLHN